MTLTPPPMELIAAARHADDLAVFVFIARPRLNTVRWKWAMPMRSLTVILLFLVFASCSSLTAPTPQDAAPLNAPRAVLEPGQGLGFEPELVKALEKPRSLALDGLTTGGNHWCTGAGGSRPCCVCATARRGQVVKSKEQHQGGVSCTV